MNSAANAEFLDNFTPYLEERFVTLLEQRSGILFTEARRRDLRKDVEFRARQCGLASFNLYLEHINRAEGEPELRELINLITINETFFFRVPQHFQALRSRVVPAIAAAKKDKTLRVWSCGCSSGEEAYSIMITLREMQLLKDYNIEILGTDINEEMLFLAQKGIYGGRTLKTVSEYNLNKYFEPCLGRYKIRESLKGEVSFRYLNLATSFRDLFSRKFDLIFFRNVLIYFSRELNRSIMEQFHQLLEPWGYLFLGPSEALWEISNSFRLILEQDCFYYSILEETGKEAPAGRVNVPFAKSCGKYISLIDNEKLQAMNLQKKSEPPQLFTSVPEKSQLLLEESELLLDLGDYRKAEQKIRQLSFQDPENREAALLHLILLANQSREEELLQASGEYLKRWPLYAEIYYLVSKHLIEKGKFEEAERELRKIIFLDQEYLAARWDLVQVLLAKKEFLEARRESRNLLDKITNGEHRRFSPRLEKEFHSGKIAAEIRLLLSKISD